MLPKSHVLYGGLLAVGCWYLFPNITLLPALLLFISSFLIDTDHYIWYVIKRKDWSLKRAYYYLKDHSTEPHQLMLFHTVEFLIFTGLLSFIWLGFYYVLVGMLYHSCLDVLDMAKTHNINAREYSLIRYFIRTYKSI